MSQVLDPDDYTIAWIAVLPVEAKAAIGLLDKLHHGHFESSRRDDYIYTAGEINGHNVVIATWPAGQNYGVSAASSLANQIKNRFHNLWFALLVGIAAGLPNHSSLDPDRRRDIRLGDVLVCVPHETHTGIVQYDLGRDTEHGFLPNSRHAEIPHIVRAAIGDIQLKHEKPFSQGSEFAQMLSALQKGSETSRFKFPGQERDDLYSPDGTEVIVRSMRDDSEPTAVWYGFLGSGNSLMRNPTQRDHLRDKYNLIGLEMEAAGVINVLPTGIIRGVCDYGDGFKNKEWQGYAAAVAAVYAKGILCRIHPQSPQSYHSQSVTTSSSVLSNETKPQPAQDSVVEYDSSQRTPAAARSIYGRMAVSGNGTSILGDIFGASVLQQINQMDQQTIALRCLYYNGMQSREDQIRQQAGSPNSIDWIWSSSFNSWLSSSEPMYWITGSPGTGKSCLMSHISKSGKTHEELQKSGMKWTIASFHFDFRAGGEIPNRLDGMLRSLLHQMVQKLPLAANKVDTTILLQKTPIPTHRLIETASNIVASADSNLCMFIDGLDEYRGSAVNLLEAISTLADQAHPKLKICLASRPEPIFLEQLGHLTHLAVQDHNGRGIDFYINSVWRGQQLDVEAKLPQELGSFVRSKASGNFLWARLAMDETMQGLLAGRSVEKLRQGLSKMPTMVEQMYEQILGRLSKIVLVEALIILRLISGAGGQIRIKKLYAGLAAVIRDADLQDQILDIDVSTDNKSRLLSILGNFLDIDSGDKGTSSARPRCSGIRFVSSELLSNQDDSFKVKFTHATLQTLCSKSEWMQTQLPSTFERLYPDNVWLRLFASEIRHCHVSDETLVSAVSEDVDKVLESRRKHRPWLSSSSTQRKKDAGNSENPREPPDVLMKLLKRWPRWTPLLPYALEEFYDEFQDISVSQDEVHTLYESAVRSNAFMLHCAICTHTTNSWASKAVYDFWRPNFSTTPPADSWAAYAAVCHSNMPAITWHLRHDTELSSTSHNPQALLDAIMFDYHWQYMYENIGFYSDVFRSLAAQGATFHSRHVCSLIDYLSDKSRNDYFATIYDLINQYPAPLFDRGHVWCDHKTMKLPEPVTQAKLMVSQWSLSRHGGARWEEGTNSRPLLDKSLSSTEDTSDTIAGLLSLALRGSVQDVSDTTPLFPYNVLEHRMSKVIEILRRSAKHEVNIDCQPTIDAAKELRASLNTLKIKNDTSETIRSHLQEEVNQIIDLLEVVVDNDAHPSHIPEDLLAHYEGFNCWYETAYAEDDSVTLDGFFLLLGPRWSYQKIGPFRSPVREARREKKHRQMIGEFRKVCFVILVLVVVVVMGLYSFLIRVWGFR